MMVRKWPQSPSKIAFLVRHVEALRNTPKYSINLHSDQNPCDSVMMSLMKQQQMKFNQENIKLKLAGTIAKKDEKVKSDMKKLSGFNKSVIISDKYGQKLMNGCQPEVALGLAMFATEMYPAFKEAVELKFEHDKAKDWVLDNHSITQINYKQNCVRIWQKLENYKDTPKILRVKYFLMDWFRNTYVCIAIFSVLNVLTSIWNVHIQEQYYFQFKGLPTILLYHLAAIVILILLEYTKPQRSVDKLDGVRDLVRGTITVKPENLFEAYQHFKDVKGIKVYALRQNIHELQNVTVNYIYNDSFIGEMQFRFQEYPNVHKSQAFLYEIDRSTCMIEILEAINKQAVWMSNNGLLTSQVELIMREQIQEKVNFDQSPYPRGSIRDPNDNYMSDDGRSMKSNMTYGGKSVINQDGGGAQAMIQRLRKKEEKNADSKEINQREQMQRFEGDSQLPGGKY